MVLTQKDIQQQEAIKMIRSFPVSKQQTSKKENPSGSPNKTKSWKINQAKLDEQTKQHPNRPRQTHQAKARQHQEQEKSQIPNQAGAMDIKMTGNKTSNTLTGRD